MSKKLEELAENLYMYRKLKKEAKQKLANHLTETQGCEYYSENGNSYCYSIWRDNSLSNKEYCNSCKISEPLHKEYLKYSKLAGATLRSILHVGKKLNETR